MTYQKIDKRRFNFLLSYGAGDDELRRFFVSNKIPLIQKGGKVQNLPRGQKARIQVLLGLPPKTDSILQKWFSENLLVANLEPSSEILGMFKMYEEETNVSMPDHEKRRLSRSCLVHLFSVSPPNDLLEFLRMPIGVNGEKSEVIKEFVQTLPEKSDSMLLDKGLALALVTILEGKDPDEYVSELPPTLAAFISGLYDIHTGQTAEVEHAIQDLEIDKAVQAVFEQYATSYAKAKESSRSTTKGIKLFCLEENDNLQFDQERDEIIGICTKDHPENSVFVHPFAIRTREGNYLPLNRQEQCENIFPLSGDVQAFQGREYPKQPKRGEIGIWTVCENINRQHRTNFHLISAKTNVYEVMLIPFRSDEFDSVREFIKELIINDDKNQSETWLFLLRDDLIVGYQHGKDLSRDEGFESGLPCWRALSGFRFENRILVPGPLPASEIYECETLASSLKKLLTSKRTGSEIITKTQQKYILGLISNGEGHLNKDRFERLRKELIHIEDYQEAADLLLEAALRNESIQEKIEALVQEEVNQRMDKKSKLDVELSKLEGRLVETKKKLDEQEKEQRSLPRNVSKAIKASVDKAKIDALETLGQVVVLKALMGEVNQSSDQFGIRVPTQRVRQVAPALMPLTESLRSLGVGPKHAKALELTGDMAFSTGIALIIEGMASRLAAEAWASSKIKTGSVFECEIGLTNDCTIKDIIVSQPGSIVILDANLSPIDIYARSLIDFIQRRLTKPVTEELIPYILISLGDSVASLPLPNSVEAISIHVSLDKVPEFLSEEDVVTIIEDMESSEESEVWLSRLWKPASKRLLAYLKGLPTDEASLILSIIRVGT